MCVVMLIIRFKCNGVCHQLVWLMQTWLGATRVNVGVVCVCVRTRTCACEWVQYLCVCTCVHLFVESWYTFKLYLPHVHWLSVITTRILILYNINWAYLSVAYFPGMSPNFACMMCGTQIFHSWNMDLLDLMWSKTCNVYEKWPQSL